jgi:hypothetical protein
MTDYTQQVIAFHNKLHNIVETNSMVAHRFRCYEMKDWNKRQVWEYRIDELIVDYVDFPQMILDNDDTYIYIRHKDGTIQNLANWDVDTKKCMVSARRNTIFLVK